MWKNVSLLWKEREEEKHTHTHISEKTKTYSKKLRELTNYHESEWKKKKSLFVLDELEISSVE